MLETIIERKRRTATDSILEYYRDRGLPHVLLVPNARFGLYAAARELLRPGDRVLISPITCRTVIEALLAAGVSPVVVNIEAATGNIDVGALSAPLVRSARAIVTTNLYGNPDSVLEIGRLAEAHHLLLIEDCAHVLHTRVGGRLVGTIGDVSVFSFKKYFDEPGGVVAARSEEAARKIRARIEAEVDLPSADEERCRYMQWLAARVAPGRVAGGLSSVYRRFHAGPAANGANPRNGVGKGLRPALPAAAVLLRVAALLSRSESLVSGRMSAAAELIARCPLECKKGSIADEVCFLVVPFFSSGRDAVVRALKNRGIATYFLYSPPVSELFVLDADPRLDHDLIRHWCRHILPIDLRFGREYLEAIQALS